MLKLASLAAAVTLSALSLLPADAQAAFRRHGGGHVAAARSHVAPIRHHFVRVAHGPRVYRSYRRGYVVAPRHYLPVVTYAGTGAAGVCAACLICATSMRLIPIIGERAGMAVAIATITAIATCLTQHAITVRLGQGARITQPL